jgi:hypothetical protein
MSNYPELITIGFYLQLTTSSLRGYKHVEIIRSEISEKQKSSYGTELA